MSRPVWPLLRRAAQSFAAGTLAGLLWSLYTVRRRRPSLADRVG